MDPITLMAGASAAFKGVQTLINNGREIEEVFGQLAKWATVVSDLQEWCGQQEKTPSIFKKLSFKDDTAEALNTVMIRQRIANQEKEIREMFQWYGPPGAYEEFIKERRRIKDNRERMIYQQQRKRKAFLYNLGYGGLLCALLFILGSLVSLIITSIPK